MWLRLTLNPILPKLVSDNRQLQVCRIKKIEIYEDGENYAGYI